MLSAIFAAIFGFSLLPGRRPLCLRFAERISGGIIPEGAEAYCRRLTWAWFAVLLACTALGAALLAAFGRRGALCSTAITPLVVATTFFVESRIRRRRFSVTFSTSGSTSKPKTIVKTFESLAKEVAFHRDRLHLSGETVFLSTIEPGHMYGTLWRVMLPAAAGCRVDPEIILTPESLIEKMKAAQKVFFVTTPSFLKRFCAYAGQYDIPRNCVEITTSGALLDAETSAAAKRVFGIAPQEIFGSTETGGVAWRRQGDGQSAFDWTVFAPVEVHVNEEGRLVVDSPFSCEKGFVMGDGAEMAPDGRHFKLLGRMDRLVKIAEQRVSLPEMEEKMRAVPGVREAALVALEGSHGPCLGAVVALDLAGRAPSELRKRALALDLRKRLLPVFPKGTVPRKYRFVHELPRNAQGKIRVSELKRMLESSWTEPFVLEAHRCANGWEADLVFDPDAVYFQGHFPGFPLLPGVVQLGVAHHFAERLLGREIVLKTVKKMKFSSVVRPTEVVHLSLTLAAEGAVAYSYRKHETVCASGIMEF